MSEWVPVYFPGVDRVEWTLPGTMGPIVREVTLRY